MDEFQISINCENPYNISTTSYFSTLFSTISPTSNDIMSSLPLSSFSWSDVFYDSGCMDPGNSGWCSNSLNDPDSYLQVDLDGLFIIYSVSTWSVDDYGYGYEWVISYDLQYSVDGVSYSSYVNNPLPGNSDPYNEQKNVLEPKVIARYIRFVPIEFNNWKSMKINAAGASLVFQFAILTVMISKKTMMLTSLQEHLLQSQPHLPFHMLLLYQLLIILMENHVVITSGVI